MMERCREQGLVMNKYKPRLRQKEVSFIGHLVTSVDLKPYQEKLKLLKKCQIQKMYLV